MKENKNQTKPPKTWIIAKFSNYTNENTPQAFSPLEIALRNRN